MFTQKVIGTSVAAEPVLAMMAVGFFAVISFVVAAWVFAAVVERNEIR